MISKMKASIFTLGVSILNSFISVVFSLVYNNYLIRFYGSETNGLISTLTQFVSLFLIFEGGFTTAAVVAVYDPYVKKNYIKLNNILYTVQKYFVRIGMVITISVLLGGFGYIHFIQSPFSIEKTYCLLCISAFTTGLSLCFCSKYTVLLQGSNREYIQVCFGLISRTVSWIVSMIMIICNVDVVFVYSVNILNILVNVILLKNYEKTHYIFITDKGEEHKEYIAGTNDVMFQKIASTIFTSTDLVLISVFINLASASVYNLYYQIYKAIFMLLAATAQAPFNSFGQIISEKNGKKRLTHIFRIYQHMILLISTIILTVTCIVIIPFVKIYTRDVKDYDYVYPMMALLLYLQIYTQIINRPYGILLNVTGNFKMQNLQCGLAAFINIVVSLTFIKQLGIYSIILGSIVATLLILLMNVYQVYNKVLKESIHRALRVILMEYLIAVSQIFIIINLNIECNSYFLLVLYAVAVLAIVTVLVVGVNLLFCYKDTIGAIEYIKKLIKQKKKNIS